MYSCSEISADRRFMLAALGEARMAATEGEVPVGAVLVRDGEILAAAHNRRESERNALRHAELMVIEEGCGRLGGWRLSDCTLYVTLEPCPMCAGAIINSRIGRVVYAARDARAGALGSVIDLSDYPFNHKPSVTSGLMAESSAELLREFFAAKRR